MLPLGRHGRRPLPSPPASVPHHVSELGQRSSLRAPQSEGFGAPLSTASCRGRGDEGRVGGQQPGALGMSVRLVPRQRAGVHTPAGKWPQPQRGWSVFRHVKPSRSRTSLKPWAGEGSEPGGPPCRRDRVGGQSHAPGSRALCPLPDNAGGSGTARVVTVGSRAPLDKLIGHPGASMDHQLSDFPPRLPPPCPHVTPLAQFPLDPQGWGHGMPPGPLIHPSSPWPGVPWGIPASLLGASQGVPRREPTPSQRLGLLSTEFRAEFQVRGWGASGWTAELKGGLSPLGPHCY